MSNYDLTQGSDNHFKYYSSSQASSGAESSSSSTLSSSPTRPHTSQVSSTTTLAPSIQGHYDSRPSTQPITISQQQSYDQSLEAERRREADMFRDVEWRSPKLDQSEREMSLKRASSAEPSQGTNTKTKQQKENGIFRKTSQKYKGLRAHLHGRTRRNSGDLMEGVEGSVSASIPENSASSGPYHRGIQRCLNPTNRLLQSLKTPRHDTPQPANAPSPTLQSSSTMPALHYPADQQFMQPYVSATHAGEAARRAASATNAASYASNSRAFVPHYQATRDLHRSRIGSIPGASDSGADLASNADLDVEMADIAEIVAPSNKCSNPVEALPTEIVALIFAHLDPESLKASQRVAKSWSRIAKDPLIWRAQYLQQYEKQTYVSPAPIQIGGAGTGIPNQPMQHWELMHDARRRIDQNWTRGDQGGKGIYLAGHTDSVYCVQFDEQKIITGSRDRTIRVWDINTYKCLKVIGGPSVRPSPGPKVLRTVEYPKFQHAESSVNGTAYGNSIYHVPSDFHSASILCLQYDHEILVTGSSDNDLLVWNVNTYEPIRRLKQHTGGVLDVAFDEKHIVSCSKDCTIIVWDRKTLEPIRTLTGHRGPVNAVQLRGNLLVSASGDGVARLWDLNKMQCVREFPQKERGLAAVEFSDDAKFVLAGGNDHITYKFDVASGEEVKTFTGHTQLVRSLFLDTQNRRVVSGSYDLDLRVYDYDTGALLGRFNEWTTSWMLAAKCDYRRIVSTSQDGRILMIDFGRDVSGQVMPGVELLKGVQPLSL
ncbi:WD40 repeat-like protein [Aureobasidium sp. EXF-12298]|nr:WD40 repeat-like protein [Aureobasidium sp. EXF-12298]